MGDTNPEHTHFSGQPRVPMQWITLPQELEEWVSGNKEMIERVQAALTDTYNNLSEEQLWLAVAETFGGQEWKDARSSLLAAEAQWKRLNAPENTPLGSIGNALDSDIINPASEKLAEAIAIYVMVNEGLRQRPDLKNLFSVVLVQKRMIEQSIALTENLRKATENLAALNATGENVLRKPFKDAAARKRRTLRAAFKKILPRRTRAARNAPSPSIPGT